MIAFGKRLKELRKNAGLTQAQLGDIVNVSKNAIHCWECDKQEPSLAIVVLLSSYFDVTTDYLLGKMDY